MVTNPIHTSLFRDVKQQENELLESIEYASLIQAALLPPSEIIRKVFGDHFVLYLPRDIVSGDFYWIAKKDDLVYFAAGDCTGHGVPGALMSILGITFLNEIMAQRSTIHPNRILNLLREMVMKALHQTGNRNESDDGMDISLCILDTRAKVLHFSGANQPLYYIRKNELFEVRGDRMPIGISGFEEKPFTEHSLEMKKGDLVYLFSDGYADQFGGASGKKMKYGGFKKKLLEVHRDPLKDQHELLLDAYVQWKGTYEQVDDILVMGIQI
jgi:serine phosphatase RsbU (regulator of sigma subunit)